MTIQPLRHPDFEKQDDATLDQAARQYLLRYAGVQILAELIARLRAFPWWSPVELRALFPAAERMNWLRERPDVRQRVTSQLTGLAPKAARNKTPPFQAALLDSVIEDGDVTIQTFEEAFSPIDIAIYGPAPQIWKVFRDRFPWREETPAHRALMEWLLEEFLAPKSRVNDWKRKPVLSALALRAAIPGRIWHLHIPLEVRVAVDDARIERERTKPTDPFLTAHELQIVTPQLMAAHIPLRELARVLDAAEREMGFALGAAPLPGAESIPIPPGSAGRLPVASPMPARPSVSTQAATVPPPGDSPPPSAESVDVNDEDFAFDDV